MDVVLVSNSPGEICGWLRPVSKELLKVSSTIDIWVCLAPCQFASGSETRVVKSFTGIRRVLSPREFLALLAIGLKPPGFAPEPGAGVVLHLGGDLAYSVLLGARLNYPVLAYTNRRAGLRTRVSRFFVSDERVQTALVAAGLPPERVQVIGNLMVDGVETSMRRSEARAYVGAQEDRPLICLMPGSRRREVELMAPFLFRCAELLRRVQRDVQFVLVLSPFVELPEFQNMVARVKYKGRIEGSAAEVREAYGYGTAVTSEGVQVRIETAKRYEVMGASDLALCSPGTATAELARLGVPQVVVLPSSVPGAIPITGIAGLASEIPFLGGLVRKWALDRMRAKIRHVALPNIAAQRRIVPELVGDVKAEDVIIEAVEILRDLNKRERISREICEAIGSPGASAKLAKYISGMLLGETYANDEKGKNG